MKSIEYKVRLGKKLKELRSDRGYTCQQVEKFTEEYGDKISNNYLSQVERAFDGRILSKENHGSASVIGFFSILVATQFGFLQMDAIGEMIIAG